MKWILKFGFVLSLICFGVNTIQAQTQKPLTPTFVKKALIEKYQTDEKKIGLVRLKVREHIAAGKEIILRKDYMRLQEKTRRAIQKAKSPTQKVKFKAQLQHYVVLEDLYL